VKPPLGLLSHAAFFAIALAGLLAVTSVAASVASQQPAVDLLSGDLRSRLEANYSIDQRPSRFSPLREDIIEDAREDQARTPPPGTRTAGASPATNTTTPAGLTPSAGIAALTQTAGATGTPLRRSNTPTPAAATSTPAKQASTATPASTVATPVPTVAQTASPAATVAPTTRPTQSPPGQSGTPPGHSTPPGQDKKN